MSLTAQQRAETPSRASGPKGLLGLILYAGFWATLLIPQVRRWRRQPSWGRIRALGGAAAACLVAAGALSSHHWLAGVGAGLLALAVWLGPLASPYRLQEAAARLGADYVLNGGTLKGERVHLFLTAEEILVTAAEADGATLERIPLSDVREVQIEGEPYRPSYAPPAKQPPAREKTADREALVELALVRESEEPLRLAYRGAFARHLAEVAAHTVLSVRSMAPGGRAAGRLTRNNSL